VDLKELQELIKTFEDSDLAEIEVEEEGRRIRLTKPKAAMVADPAAYMAPQIVQPMTVAAPAPVAAAPVAAAAVAQPEADEDEGLVTIDSPMVGTFYAAPAPSEPVFVKVGDTVEEGQTVCIVEAMKLMNELTAKFPAVIEKILVENAEPVEFGQPLFAVRPLE